MSALDNVMNEIKNESDNVEVAETQEAKPTETQSANENEKMADESTEKVDKNQFTDAEKATYSLKRQMAKQKSRYEQQIADKDKQFDELKNRLERLENPEKYREKYRDSFKTDDEYIDYIVQQRMEKILAERDKETAKQKETEEQNLNRATEINQRIERCFPTEAERVNYVTKVQEAFEQGLEELMDKEKYVSEYIQKHPIGPKILYELATHPDLVKRVFSQGDPMSRIMELKLYERDLESAQTKATPAIDPNKVIGRPGISTSKSSNDIFANNDDLKQFIRRR